MNAVVAFRTATGSYAVDVADTGVVLELEQELQPLPSPRPGVAGVVRVAGETLPVLDVLGEDGEQMIVVHGGQRRFLLRVREVTGVIRLPPGHALEPAPAGQDGPLVRAVVPAADGALLLDTTALGHHFGL